MLFRFLPIVMAAASQPKAVSMRAKLIAKMDFCAVRTDTTVQITGMGTSVEGMKHVSLSVGAATIITEDIIDRQKPSF
ncbi:hypothetical protein D3Z51_14560 [Clostridiaceae bacterium]|nr:hypothetical protein [Clostridiaceae bacterium]RKI11395.1 hypothetical protein D7V81_14010 [bacterium 1XD21-70]